MPEAGEQYAGGTLWSWNVDSTPVGELFGASTRDVKVYWKVPRGLAQGFRVSCGSSELQVGLVV